MLSKKRILWVLTLVTIAVIGTNIFLRRMVLQRKAAAAAQVKKNKNEKKEKAVNDPDKESGEEPPPALMNVPQAIVLGPAAREHLAEKSFISDLRAVFLWRSRQPVNPETNRTLLEKLFAIACEDLAPARKSAWQSMLQAWKSAGDPAKATDPKLQQAAETLNAMFKAHGDGDIVL